MQSVIVQGTVYIGGGDAGLGSPNDYIVMAYETSSGKWATLPPYRARDFAMTVINNHLVLVGGRERLRGDKIKVAGVWRPDSKEWTHPYPDMFTPRSNCSAVAYKEWLVVAGGVGEGWGDLSFVEVLNTDTKQWSAAPPTPTPWNGKKTAVVGDFCYFIGGLIMGVSTNEVFRLSFPALLSQLNKRSDSEIWKEMPKLPVISSTPLSISGSLLAVGGRDKDGAASGIHLYQPDTDEWVKVGDLPTPQWNCACTMLTDSELFVAGGWDGYLRLKGADILSLITTH